MLFTSKTCRKKALRELFLAGISHYNILMLFSPSAVVEELFKRREPMPSMDVVYFIQPAREKYCHSKLFSIILYLEEKKVYISGI